MPRATLRRRQRLTHATQFACVYEARMKKHSGPLLVSSSPNNLAFPRLGLAVSRRVGGAVTRNRMKRLVRESFRLMQHDIAPSATGSYDFIVSIRANTELDLQSYSLRLAHAIEELHREWTRRTRRAAPKPEGLP